MVSHDDVAKAWIQGRKLTGHNVFTDGKTIYSYGEHFPIAHKKDKAILFNTNKYSSSTSKHQSIVGRNIPEGYKVYECNTGEIIDAIKNESPVVVICAQPNYDEERPPTVEEALYTLERAMKSKGVEVISPSITNKITKLVEDNIEEWRQYNKTKQLGFIHIIRKTWRGDDTYKDTVIVERKKGSKQLKYKFKNIYHSTKKLSEKTLREIMKSEHTTKVEYDLPEETRKYIEKRFITQSV